jgi:hypothetical protein
VLAPSPPGLQHLDVGDQELQLARDILGQVARRRLVARSPQDQKNLRGALSGAPEALILDPLSMKAVHVPSPFADSGLRTQAASARSLVGHFWVSPLVCSYQRRRTRWGLDGIAVSPSVALTAMSR